MKQKAENQQENLDKDKTKPIRKASKKPLFCLKEKRQKLCSEQKKIK